MVVDTEEQKQLSDIFRALADSTRRTIVEELKDRNDQSLFELHTKVLTKHGVSLTRQGFSRHLSTLEGAGIIETRWEGATKLHSLKRDVLTNLTSRWLRKIEEEE